MMHNRMLKNIPAKARVALFAAMMLAMFFAPSLVNAGPGTGTDPFPGFDLIVKTECNSTSADALLYWTNIIDPSATYTVYRCQGLNCAPDVALITGPLTGGTTSYTDSTVNPATTYRYKIDITNSNDILVASSEQGATTCSVTKSCVGSTPSVAISWRSHWNPGSDGLGVCLSGWAPMRQTIFDAADSVVFSQDSCFNINNPQGVLTWNGGSSNTRYKFEFMVPLLSPWNDYSTEGFSKKFTVGTFKTLDCAAPPPPPPTCTPGDTQTQSCTTSKNCAGTQLRTCQSNSEWGGFGACSDVPGDGCPAGPPPPPPPGACNNGVDIGLRLYENGIRKIAVEPGSPTSLLRIFKDSVRGIVLVNPSDPNASKMLIQTPSGVKALCLL